MSDDARGDKPGGAASAEGSTAADLLSLMLQVMMPPEPAAQQKGPDAGAGGFGAHQHVQPDVEGRQRCGFVAHRIGLQ